MRVRYAVVVLLVGSFVVPRLAAAADPARTCGKKKLAAAGKRIADELKCDATAAGKGIAVDAACVAKAELKLATAFAKAEAKGGCPTLGDASTIESFADECTATVRQALGAAMGKNACLKGKLGAGGKKTAAKIQCSATAAAKGRAADPACLLKAEAAFAKAFAKLEAKGGCVTSGDAAAVEAAIDAECVARFVGALPVPTLTPTPTRTATPLPTKTATPTRTPTPIATPTNNGCPEAPPTPFAINVAEQNVVRLSAQPAPDPALAPLCWNAVIAATAQAWADGCLYQHNPNLGTLGYGENLYACASTDASCPANAADDSVPSWANEAVSYDYASNTCSVRCQGGVNHGATCAAQSACPGGVCSGECGHYTQLVWRATTATGCGIKQCTQNSPFQNFPTWTLVVCDYEPAGNVNGARPY